MGRGRYLARFADGVEDIARAQRLRHEAFFGADSGGSPEKRDMDAHDRLCRHLLVEDGGGNLVCTARLFLLPSGAGIGRTYAARFYDVSGLESFGEPMLELGRFCLCPRGGGPDAIRVAWAKIAGMVEDEGVRMLFGCASLCGTVPEAHAATFAQLAERHLAPPRWRPGVRAPEVFHFADRRHEAGVRAAMPSLIRFYLALGAWVSDHAVIDRQMGTLHVLVTLDVDRIPAARRRFLQAAM